MMNAIVFPQVPANIPDPFFTLRRIGGERPNKRNELLAERHQNSIFWELLLQCFQITT